MKEIISAIDREIASYCFQNKLSNEKFASIMGMSANTLHSKRSGYTDWKWSEIIQLSNLLGKTPNELAGLA